MHQRQPEHPWAFVAVDVVVLTIRERQLQVMAIRRGAELQQQRNMGGRI